MVIDKLFYVILSYYSRNTEHKVDTPVITVFFIFTLLLFCLQLFLVDLTKLLFIPNVARHKYSKALVWGILFLCGLCVYFFFIWQKRYLIIYDRYRSDVFLNSPNGKILNWAAAIVILLSPIIFAVVKNKITRGFWV
jgi:hypothetical protein